MLFPLILVAEDDEELPYGAPLDGLSIVVLFNPLNDLKDPTGIDHLDELLVHGQIQL
jgi:hypothetical protein